jgi:glucose-6-phosphate 1-dehydrogenase
VAPFWRAPLALFQHTSADELQPNVLVLHIQPDEGISIRFIAKNPGVGLALKNVSLKFSYKDEFAEKMTDAYERILLDIFNGDQTLCSRSDELAHSWELITNILEGWSGPAAPGLFSYRPGTWGPQEANDLIKKDGRSWLPE